MGPVQIARDGEEPWPQTRVRQQPGRVADQPEPRFVEQILGERAISSHPEQEREHPWPVHVVHLVERAGVAGAEPRHEHLLVVWSHRCHNPPAGRA